MQAIARMFTPSKSKPSAPAPLPMPEAPKQESAQETAEKTALSKRKAISRSKTVFTSPLGIGGTADIVRKTLTGQ